MNSIVYSRDVIEFVTVANEYCAFLETAGTQTTRLFLDKLHKILPLLYLKTSVLPEFESYEEIGLEKFVSEVDYNFIQQKIMNLLGEHDDFQEVFDLGMQFSDAPLSSSISECMADIYQDLKDFLMLYQIGNEEIMSEALWTCVDHFKSFWGQRLVNSLRAVHLLVYGDFDFDTRINFSEKKEDEDNNKPDWLNQLFNKDQGD